MSVSANVARIASRQHGVVSVRQLLSCGLTYSGICRWAAASRLHQVWPRVYSVGHAALSREGRWMAAVLTAGPRAALAHQTAGVVWKCLRRDPRTVHVILPHGHRPVAGITFHVSRTLHAGDITHWRGIPVTTPSRTIVDLADVLRLDPLLNAIHEADFRGRVDFETLHSCMERNRRRPGRGRLVRALGRHLLGDAGCRSDEEAAGLVALAAAGVELPRTGVQVPVGGGAAVEPDWYWEDRGVAVEVDGAGHRRARTKADDARRTALLERAGVPVYRVETDLVEQDPEQLVVFVRAVLARHPVRFTA